MHIGFPTFSFNLFVLIIIFLCCDLLYLDNDSECIFKLFHSDFSHSFNMPEFLPFPFVVHLQFHFCHFSPYLYAFVKAKIAVSFYLLFKSSVFDCWTIYTGVLDKTSFVSNIFWRDIDAYWIIERNYNQIRTWINVTSLLLNAMRKTSQSSNCERNYLSNDSRIFHTSIHFLLLPQTPLVLIMCNRIKNLFP